MTVAVASLAAEEAESALLTRAQAIVGIHRRDPSGMCIGCLEGAARLAWSPCEREQWARAVLDIAVYREVRR